MADQTPPDVEAIRARVDAAINADSLESARRALLAMKLNAPADLRRLLDENARLNAELDEWRHVGAQANQGLKDAAAELEARNNEITRMGKEIVKANTAFAAIREIEPTLRHIVGKGTRAQRDLLDAVEVLIDKALPAAPEMPRPPAEEADHEQRAYRMGSLINLTCSCEEFAVSFVGGASKEDLDAKFAEHLAELDDEPEPDLTLIPAELIVSDPEICSGRPTMRGTRILAEMVAGHLAAGTTWEELHEWYPSIPTPNDPAAEEALTEYRCPNCNRWALWTDGLVDGDDEGVEEFWCQTCGSQTALENMDSRPQERAGDAGTPDSGSGTGTGVTEAPGAQETERHWLKFNKDREITGCSCGFEANIDSDCGWGDSVVAHLVAVGRTEKAAALKESIRLDRSPSLPVPSTEEGT